VLSEVPAIEVDYLEVRDSALGPAPVGGAGRLLVAARLGKTRLLDNMAIDIGTTVGADGRVPTDPAQSCSATMRAVQRPEQLGNQPLESHWRN
jgi:pantoate--beta-alanine ligase